MMKRERIKAGLVFVAALALAVLAELAFVNNVVAIVRWWLRNVESIWCRKSAKRRDKRKWKRIANYYNVYAIRIWNIHGK